MAKDPAFLFYPGDWLGGTMTFTRHQKGCYIDLLMAQFNNGPLSLESIKTILGQDQAVWTVLSSKFKQDPKGLYYNEKMATEIEKRKNYTASRSLNKKGKTKKTHEQTHENHISNDMEDVIENRDLKGKGSAEGKPGLLNDGDSDSGGLFPKFSPAFSVHWNKWKKFLEEKGKLPTYTTATEHASLLKRHTERQAEAMISYSVNGGYTSLFAPKSEELTENERPKTQRPTGQKTTR